MFLAWKRGSLSRARNLASKKLGAGPGFTVEVSGLARTGKIKDFAKNGRSILFYYRKLGVGMAPLRSAKLNFKCLVGSLFRAKSKILLKAINRAIFRN